MYIAIETNINQNKVKILILLCWPIFKCLSNQQWGQQGRYKFDNLQSMRCRQIVQTRAAHIPVQEISNTYFEVVGFNNAGDFDELSPTSSVAIVWSGWTTAIHIQLSILMHQRHNPLSQEFLFDFRPTVGTMEPIQVWLFKRGAVNIKRRNDKVCRQIHEYRNAFKPFA